MAKLIVTYYVESVILLHTELTFAQWLNTI